MSKFLDLFWVFILMLSFVVLITWIKKDLEQIKFYQAMQIETLSSAILMMKGGE